MSRIATKIKEARLKAKMTEKQLAKKCGLTEKYIIQVESGKKVINEKAAERILQVLGEKLEFVEEDYNKKEPKPVERKEESKKEEIYNIKPTDQWSDALANIIKKFPIYDITNNKVVGHKDLPILGKKVEGYSWDKIMFIQAPNNMEAFRIQKHDIIMAYTTNEIQNNCIYVFEVNNKKMVGQLRKQSNNKVDIYFGIKGEGPIYEELNKIKVIGKCVKVEFELDKK